MINQLKIKCQRMSDMDWMSTWDQRRRWTLCHGESYKWWDVPPQTRTMNIILSKELTNPSQYKCKIDAYGAFKIKDESLHGKWYKYSIYSALRGNCERIIGDRTGTFYMGIEA